MRSTRAFLLVSALTLSIVSACVLNPQPDVPSDDGTKTSAGGSGGANTGGGAGLPGGGGSGAVASTGGSGGGTQSNADAGDADITGFVDGAADGDADIDGGDADVDGGDADIGDAALDSAGD